MNKKTLLRMIALMVVAGMIGVVLTLGLLKLNQTAFTGIAAQIGDFIIENSLVFYVGLLLCLFLPAVYQYQKAKRNYEQITHISDDLADSYEKAGEKSFNLSMLLNNMFLILNFMLFGMTFYENREDIFLIISVFMFGMICSSILEIVAIKYVQKNDNRLKGEPTSLRFHQEFLESCDEAEKLKIYKSGYHAFRISKNLTLGLIIVTIISNLTFYTGIFPIFISGLLMLIQVASYHYYAYKS